MRKENTSNAESSNQISRSEEVTDIIERMPVGWTYVVSAIICIVIIFVLILSCIIQYPDTVVGQITITGESAPVKLVAEVSSRIHLLVQNNTKVAKGECIGYFENGASYDDILILDTLCSRELNFDVQFSFPDSLALGTLSNVYNDFVVSYNQFDIMRKTKIYDNMRRSLNTQKRTTENMKQSLHQKSQLDQIIFTNIQKQYIGDSILYTNGALSRERLDQQYNNLLSNQQSIIEVRIQEYSKQEEINNINIELAKLDLNQKEELISAYNMMNAKFNILNSELRQWKEHYLCCSPIEGHIEYLGFWRENTFIPAATELFSISPDRNRYIGEMYMSVTGAGKVEKDMDVNIKLVDYPYDEFGYIKGKVLRISKLPSNMQPKDGQAKAYLVNIVFPDGIETNYGKRLYPNYEAIGSAEIITKKRRLIQRLFDNLKSQKVK